MDDMITHSFHYRKKSTGWQVILSYKTGGKWKQKSKQGFAQKNLAKAAGEKLLKELEENYVPTPEDPILQNITLEKFWFIYKEDKCKNMETSTIVNYKCALKCFPQLCRIPLVKLTNVNIQNAINTSPVSISTTKTYMGKLSAMMSHALTFYQLINKNPFTMVTYPKEKEKSPVKTITSNEFSMLYLYLKDAHYLNSVVASIAYYTGMRYAEIIGLTWDNIDLKHNEIKVTQQFKLFMDENNVITYKLAPLKTLNSYRNIPIPDTLNKIIAEYGNAKIHPANDGRIFPVRTSYSSNINKDLQKVLPKNSIHDLRHTYATTLLSKGVDIKTVAALLGDTVKVVIDTYLDYTESMRKNAAQNIKKIFD